MELRHAMLAVVMFAGTVLVELASDACLDDLGQNSVWGAEQAAADAAPARPGVVEIKLGATIPRSWEQVQADDYAYGRTDVNGDIVFQFRPETAGMVDVVVSTPNHIPYAGSASVDASTAPNPVADGWQKVAARALPGNDLEIEIFRILLQRYSLVHGELLVSGPGLLRLYETLANITGRKAAAGSPAAVSQLAMERGDETAVLALNTFAGLLGSIAGDFVLANGSYGGVFLAGGIVPTMIPFLQRSNFHQRFCDKGALDINLRSVPIYVITTAQPGLIGAAHATGAMTTQN